MTRNLKATVEQLGGFVSLNSDGAVELIDFYGRGIDDKSLAFLRDADTRAVRYLSLAGSAVTDASLAMLDCLPKLESLALFRTGITGVGFDGNKTPGLKSVNVLGCREISVAGFSRLATIKNIERLKLSESSINDEGLGFVAMLPNLKMLWADSTEISDVGLAKLSSAQKLGMLSVDYTKVTPEGIKRIYEAIPRLSQSIIM